MRNSFAATEIYGGIRISNGSGNSWIRGWTDKPWSVSTMTVISLNPEIFSLCSLKCLIPSRFLTRNKNYIYEISSVNAKIFSNEWIKFDIHQTFPFFLCHEKLFLSTNPSAKKGKKVKKYSLWCLLNSKTNVFFWISKNYEMIDPLMLFNGINTSRRTSNVLDPITWVSWNYGRGGKTLDVRGCNKYFWRAS